MTYAYRCKVCGAQYESTTRGDRLEACRTPGCDGIPRRLWSTGLLRENIRAVPKG